MSGYPWACGGIAVQLAIDVGATNLEQARITMYNARNYRHRRRPARLAARISALLGAALAAILLASGTASAQPPGTATAAPSAQATAPAATLGGPDLQGIWDFTMRVGDRLSPGFFAIGPVEQGWAGSLTL